MPENGNTVVTAFLASFLVLIDIYKKGFTCYVVISDLPLYCSFHYGCNRVARTC